MVLVGVVIREDDFEDPIREEAPIYPNNYLRPLMIMMIKKYLQKNGRTTLMKF